MRLLEAADLFIIHGGWGGIAAGGPGALMLITPRPLLSPHTALLSLITVSYLCPAPLPVPRASLQLGTSKCSKQCPPWTPWRSKRTSTGLTSTRFTKSRKGLTQRGKKWAHLLLPKVMPPAGRVGCLPDNNIALPFRFLRAILQVSSHKTMCN